MPDYGYVRDLRDEVTVPQGGILSRTLHSNGRSTLTIFAFDAGQELTEHASSKAATIEILDGTADLVIGGDPLEGVPGTWVSMPPGMRHSIHATSPLVMLLTLVD
jgi:quercetin dioxygenase-like cupin family protein